MFEMYSVSSVFDIPAAAVLAQQNGGLPLEGAGETGTTQGTQNGSTGGGNGGGGAPTRPTGLDPTWMIFLVIIAGLFIWMIFSQRREQKRRQAMIGSIKKHDRVQTVGGIIGSVVEVKPDTIVVKVDESSNTRMTFARSSVQQVLTEEKTSKAEKA